MTTATIEQISKANTEAAAKSAHSAEQIAKADTENLAKSSHAAEQITKASTDALAKTGQVTQQIVKGHTEALTKSGNAAMAGFQELAKAYQSLATKNAEKLTASMKAMAGAKTPVEFVELQHKLASEGVEDAVSDYRHIAKLTAAIFTAAFEPVKKQVEALQSTVAH
jgi:phasin family protein